MGNYSISKNRITELKYCLLIVCFLSSNAIFSLLASTSTHEVYYQQPDSMQFIITKDYTKSQLRKLVKKIRKEHNSILSYTDLTYNDAKEIVTIQLKLIDSKIQTFTFISEGDAPIAPIEVYTRADGTSGVAYEKKVVEIPDEVILAKIETANTIVIEAETKKIIKKPGKVKYIVTSSHTVPKKLLTEKEQLLLKSQSEKTTTTKPIKNRE